jgi:signal transduction histidine kinase
MSPEEKQPSTEREQTDESLRVEREKADALGDRLAAIEETADAVISTARARADEVLSAARARTDRQTHTANSQSSHRLETKRAQEDEVIREERADADETVRVARAEHNALLSFERRETDEDLSSERARADDAIATRDEFLGVVSHDLRNMLGVMVGFAALIVREEAAASREGKVLQYAQRIQRSGARMSRLIGDLVDVGSVELGVLKMTPEPGDPAHVVREAVDTFHAQAAAGGVSLVTDAVPSSSQVAFDSARILQVLTNLLTNALKFTPPNGTVAVHLERNADEIRFGVSDTGTGIPADKLDAIFDRFYQVVPNDRRGVGLGLYISKCIVQGHGGRIWAESKLGEGSTFCFTLPVPRSTSA